jgi:hypothetical protein
MREIGDYFGLPRRASPRSTAHHVSLAVGPRHKSEPDPRPAHSTSCARLGSNPVGRGISQDLTLMPTQGVPLQETWLGNREWGGLWGAGN